MRQISTERHPAYHGPAEPGSPFHLSHPDNDPLPDCTRALIVWADRITGDRRISTWTEYDPATGEVVAAGSSDTAEDRP